MSQQPEHRGQPQQEAGQPVKKGFARKSARGVYLFSNLLFPVGEMVSVGKQSGNSLKTNASRIRQLLQVRREQSKEQLTYEQAVAYSGLSPQQLIAKFRLLKRFWWVIAAITLLMTPVLAIMIALSAPALPGATLIRACTFVAIFAALASIASLKVVTSQYRLWQLQHRRLSVEEGGTFENFRSATRWIKDSVNPV